MLLNTIFSSLGIHTYVKTNKNEVFLTFDDGPHPKITPWVLDILHKYDAKATFFCVGKNIEQFPDIFQQILLGGHQIGNHSFSHYNGFKTPKELYISDIHKCQTYISNNLFRPPYGKISISQWKILKQVYKIYGWSISAKDYDSTSLPNQRIKHIVKNSKPGSILLFHDSEKAFPMLQKILPEILHKLQQKNFIFSSLS